MGARTASIDKKVDITSLFGSKIKASAAYWMHFMARFGGVHVFGYNSTKSEPIWMKSEAL